MPVSQWRKLRTRLRRRTGHVLLALTMLLSLLPASLPEALPQAVASAIPPAVNAALAPASAQAQVTGVSNFGSAVDCLTAPDQFVTTCSTDTIFNPPANPNDVASAPGLVQFGTSGKTNKLAVGQIGSTYGLAYDDGVASGERRLFIGAYAQRFATYGPGGAGAIDAYNLDTGAVSTHATSWLEPSLRALSPTPNQRCATGSTR